MSEKTIDFNQYQYVCEDKDGLKHYMTKEAYIGHLEELRRTGKTRSIRVKAKKLIKELYREDYAHSINRMEAKPEAKSGGGVGAIANTEERSDDKHSNYSTPA